MITQVLHCPYCQEIDIVKHGTSPEGKQRYRCRACLEGRGRTFLLAYSYAGQSPEVKQQIVDMAMNASGIRDTARVLHVSPTTVINACKKRRLTGKRCIPTCCGTSTPSRSRWRYGVRMRWRCVVGSAPSSTRCGATCAAKPIRAGYGTPLITTRVRCWPMYSDDGRTPSFWSSKRCESPLASRAISPTGGVPTNGMWRQRSTQ